MRKTSKSEHKKSTGRKCSVCTHERKDKINKLIAEGVSFHDISRQILGSARSKDAIYRHSNKCLKLDVASLKQLIKEEQAIDHQKEL